MGDPDDLLDRELRGLAAPRAPRTLLPRVLAATIHAQRPAPTGWFTWPLWWRAASVAAVALVAFALWSFGTAPPTEVTAAADTAGDVAAVIRVFWDVLLEPVAKYMFLLGVSLALACAAAWAALEFALGGASHR